MSLAGFKKQINKTSQFLSEKVGGNKGSELDDELVDLGRKLDVINDCVENMQHKTKEYLQPNPSQRTKLAVQTSFQKVRGQATGARYTQPECNLAETFMRMGHGLSFDDTCVYGGALSELGTAFNKLAEVKDAMEEEISQSFLMPLFEMQQKDLKDIAVHRKKLESRRLDYDYKKSKGAKTPTEDMQAAADKFEDSKEVCVNSMSAFLDHDDQHVKQLHAFAEAITDYHKKSASIMDTVTKTLTGKLSEAESKNRSERKSFSVNLNGGENNNTDAYDRIASSPPKPSPPVPPVPEIKTTPSCQALYDFDAENEGELEFRRGDVIEITCRIDDNWLEGTCKGKFGYFPENFVQVLVQI